MNQISNPCLSSWQREQYTQYLETQLQKFSCFMLSQKKENETYKTMQEAIDKQSQHIDTLTNKIKALESFQRENFQQYSRLEGSTLRKLDIEARLNQIEDICLRNQQQNTGTKENIMKLGNLSRLVSESGNVEIWEEFEVLRTEVMGRVQKLQKDIRNISRVEQRSMKRNSQLNTDHSDLYSTNACLPIEFLATKKQLRNSEDKIYEFFSKKLSKVQKMVRKVSNTYNSSKHSYAPSTTGTQQLASNAINQQKTFAFNNNDYSDYTSAVAHDKSQAISDNSINLQPVMHFPHIRSNKSVQRQKKPKKQRSKKSQNGSLSKSKSHSENSRSFTHSRSKSIKRRQSTARNHSKKSMNEKCEYGFHQYVNEYKKMCKKKHY